MKARRWQWFALAAAFLLAIALAKIDIALTRGRSNITFLIVLAGFALLLLGQVVLHRRTALGDAVLRDLRRLFRRSVVPIARASAGGVSSDTMLVAAVFGLAALPSAAFADIRTLFAKSDSSGSGGCGSSDGGSSGGCGGGGGCGGCGG
jgi:uncharacterized protein (TIGR04222 family)